MHIVQDSPCLRCRYHSIVFACELLLPRPNLFFLSIFAFVFFLSISLSFFLSLYLSIFLSFFLSCFFFCVCVTKHETRTHQAARQAVGVAAILHQARECRAKHAPKVQRAGTAPVLEAAHDARPKRLRQLQHIQHQI